MAALASRFIRPVAPVLAVIAVAVAGLAPAPARASDDLGRILAGAAGIAILYGILQSERRSRAHAAPAPAHKHRGHAVPHRRPAVLPARCAVELRGRGQRSDMLYRARCMAQAGVDLRRLPQRCAVAVRGQHRERTAYSGACLARAGWQAEPVGRRR